MHNKKFELRIKPVHTKNKTENKKELKGKYIYI